MNGLPARTVAMLVGVLGSWIVAAPAHATSSFTFDVLAQRTDAMPGHAGRAFDSFGAPAIDGTLVAYSGSSYGSVTFNLPTIAGIYRQGVSVASPSIVADTSGSSFGGINFDTFSDTVAVDGSKVGFSGRDTDAGNIVNGNYTRTGASAISLLADENTIAPGSSETFNYLGEISLGGGKAAVTGVWPEPSPSPYSDAGVMTANGSLNVPFVHVDDNPPGPTTSYWSFGSNPHTDGSAVVYAASLDATFASGLFFHNSSKHVQMVAGGQSLGGSETIGSWIEPVVDGDDVFFVATINGTPGGSGVFHWDADTMTLSLVARDGDLTANGHVIGGGFQAVAVDNGRAVFSSGIDYSIYLYEDGSIHRIATPGDVIDGVAIDGAYIGPNAISGNRVAFSFSGPNFNAGVAVASIIPEPVSASLLAVGVLMLTRRRRRFP
jgi:hypothetical protein